MLTGTSKPRRLAWRTVHSVGGSEAPWASADVAVWTVSTPASMPPSTESGPRPVVQWVTRCTGTGPQAALSAGMIVFTRSGVSSPLASLRTIASPPSSSMHSKPASSRMPATGSIWAVVMRVAHRHWCASRNVVSITFTLLTRPSRRLPVLLDPARVNAAGDEVRMLEHAAMERDGGGDALHVEVGQRAAHASDGGGPIAVSHDDLGQQRVVERRHRRPGRDVRVDPDALAERRLPSRDQARTGAEVQRRIFGRGPALDGMTPHDDGGLAEAERLAGGDAEAGGDEIDAGQHLRHGVLDLDACIHLDEVEATAGRLEDELDGAGVAIPDLAHEREGGVAHARAKGRRHRGRGSFLEQLLVAPLERAIALTQMDCGAFSVGQDLDLHVAHTLEEAFGVERGIAERGACLGLRADECVGER